MSKEKTIAKPVMGRPKIYTEERIREEADALLQWIKLPTSNYIGVFAAERGYNRARLAEFANSNEYFSVAYQEAIQWQENKFCQNALDKTWDPGFTTRVMSRVCRPEWRNSWDKENQSDNNLELVKALAEIMGKSKGIGECSS